jgi:hypothetical protein
MPPPGLGRGEVAEGLVLAQAAAVETTANRAFADPEDWPPSGGRGPRQLQYRHDVLDGCLTGTGSCPPHPDDITLSKSVVG